MKRTLRLLRLFETVFDDVDVSDLFLSCLNGREVFVEVGGR